MTTDNNCQQPPSSSSSSSFFQSLLQSLDHVPFVKQYVEWWINLLHENPIHLFIETTLILVILLILIQRPKKKGGVWLDNAVMEAVLEERVRAFTPEPLAPNQLSEDDQAILDHYPIIKSHPAKSHVKLEGFNDSSTHVNFASADFLALGGTNEVIKSAEEALDKYGVGSCGPRGFYGTIDAHVKVEEALAKCFNADEAIIYSDASSAVASAIPAFSNRSDLLVVDKGSNDNILTGVRLSRAQVIYYEHNDMKHLEKILEQIAQDDKRLKRTSDGQRRFIIFEGLSRLYGDIAPLDKIVELKLKYKWRLIVDETLSFGTLGECGRGITELFKIPRSEIEILVGSMETTLASVGGFCVGTFEVVEHQRLNGAGYCFSASAPPFTATAAQKALEIMLSPQGIVLLKTLREKAQLFYSTMLLEGKNVWTILSSSTSPVVHLKLSNKKYEDASAEMKALRNIAKKALNKNILVIPSKANSASLPGDSSVIAPNVVTMRLYLHADHTDAEIRQAVQILVEAVG
jgi:serine palmitoyltransferase